MLQQNLIKKVLFVLVVSCIIFLVIYFKMLRHSQFIYNQPIGGWESVKAEIDKKYSYDTDLKNAAFQLGEAIQAAIDDPNRAREIYQYSEAALACLGAVIEHKKLDYAEYSKTIRFVEDVSTKEYFRQRRYIRYNYKLSGYTYKLPSYNLSSCKFKLEEK